MTLGMGVGLESSVERLRGDLSKDMDVDGFGTFRPRLEIRSPDTAFPDANDPYQLPALSRARLGLHSNEKSDGSDVLHAQLGQPWSGSDKFENQICILPPSHSKGVNINS